MRKTFIKSYTLLCLVALLTLASCQKDKLTGSSFTATIEKCTDYNTKTVLSGQNLHWEAGDQIIIFNDYLQTGIYTAATGGSTTTTFDYMQIDGMIDVGDDANYNEDNRPSGYYAIYPADIMFMEVTPEATLGGITIPAVQQTTDGSLHGFPMYAESATKALSFKNILGLLKFTLQKDNTTITSISVTADHEINGKYYAQPNWPITGDVPALTYANSGTTTTTLRCGTGNGISIATSKDFYIYLPAGEYSSLTINITNSDGGFCTLTANTTIPVVRSQYTTISLNDTDLEFTDIAGLFSVAPGQYVQFSPGNLQYDPNVQAPNSPWGFAPNQYTMMGINNYNYFTGENNNTKIDLFSWGEAAPTTAPSTNYNDYGTFVEWGNYINNGNDGWYTLSAAQWQYLIGGRSNASNLYGGATVNGVKGLILLPDSWSLPAGCDFNYGFAYPDFYNTNEYSSTEWTVMETAGAVFLPAAGAMMFNYSSTNNEYLWYYSYSVQSLEEDENANWVGQIVINIFNALYLALKDANFYWTSTPVSASGILNSSESPSAYIAAFTNLPEITGADNGGDIYSFPDNLWYPDPDSHPDSYINFSEVFDPTSGIGHIPGQYIFQLPLNTPAKGAVRLVRNVTLTSGTSK